MCRCLIENATKSSGHTGSSPGAGWGRQDDMPEVNQLQHLSKKPDESRSPDPGAARMSVRALTNAKIGKMLSIRDAGCFSGALPR